MIKNIKSIFTNDYNNIIDRIDKFKYEKTNFIYDEFNKNLKYIDYALEECLLSEKILMTISNISKYDVALDKMVVTLINSNLQKHIFCISTYINKELCKFESVKVNNISKNCFTARYEFIYWDNFMYFIIKYKYNYNIVVYGETICFPEINKSSFLFTNIIYMLLKYINVKDSKKYKYFFHQIHYH
jgi:hypothetical protein